VMANNMRQVVSWAMETLATRQWPATTWASTSAMGARPSVMLFKYAMNEDHQATLRRRKGLAGTKLGLDKDLTPV
jgi:hypothetical protein